MNQWRMGLHSVKKRIWFVFGYDKRIVDEIKASVPGAKWDKNERLWHAPLDMEVARDIRKVAKKYKGTIKVEPELADWAKAEKKRYASIIRPDDFNSNFEHLLPRLRKERPNLIHAMETKPWQIPGAGFAVEQKHVLIADEPGLGKTIQTIAAIAECNVQGPILVIAPKSAVAITWPEQIAQWLGLGETVLPINAEYPPALRRMILQEALKTQNKRVWILVGPNYIRIRADLDQYGNYVKEKGKKVIRVVNEALPELFAFKWHAIIVDESHETLAVDKGDKKKWSAQRLGLSALDLAPGGFRIAISGTPMRGRTENMWGTLNWLQPDKYTSIWKWYKRHYGVMDQHNVFGADIVKGDQVLDEKRFFEELRPVMIRRTKAEVAPWLPPKVYGGTHLDPADDTTPVAVWLPMSKKQTKQYNEITKEALIHFDVDELTINGVLAELTRFKQVANSCLEMDGYDVKPALPSNKYDWLEAFLIDRVSAGTKVIVASQFTSFLTVVSKQLNLRGIHHYLFTGSTSASERKQIKQDFQGDGDGVLLLNTKAGGVALDLDAADDVVICDQTWNPDDQTQVEDRAHRISRIHNVTVWYLASLGTIDEAVAIANNQMNKETSLIDRQRNVKYVKQIVSMVKQQKAISTA